MVNCIPDEFNRQKYGSIYNLVTPDSRGKASKNKDIVVQLSKGQQTYNCFTLDIYDLKAYNPSHQEDTWEFDCNNGYKICSFGDNYITARIKGNLITEVIETGHDGTDRMKRFISEIKDSWEGLTIRDAISMSSWLAKANGIDLEL